MEGSFAEELYSEILQPAQRELVPSTRFDCNQNNSGDCDGDDLWQEEDSAAGEWNIVSDLDREWQRRHDQFHTIGYRDGLLAGKEAAAQEGFNIGFKQSVFVGYNWGLVRGVTGVLACLPDGLKEQLVEIQEKRDDFQLLYESVHQLSTTDALRLFNEDINARKAEEHVKSDASSEVADLPQQNLDSVQLEKYYGELRKLLLDTPAINVHFLADHR